MSQKCLLDSVQLLCHWKVTGEVNALTKITTSAKGVAATQRWMLPSLINGRDSYSLA